MNKRKSGSIVLTGVGGQGVLTAAEIIAQACLLEGYDVKKSEIHGMAQRGGSVVSHVRYSGVGAVASPLPARGSVDLLVGFELLEAVRALDWLAPDATAVVNHLLLAPPAAQTGQICSQQDYLTVIEKNVNAAIIVNGEELARRAGNIRTANTVIIGAEAPFLPISLDNWQQAVEVSVPRGTGKSNWEAFKLGRSVAAANDQQKDDRV